MLGHNACEEGLGSALLLLEIILGPLPDRHVGCVDLGHAVGSPQICHSGLGSARESPATIPISLKSLNPDPPAKDH